MSEEIKNQNEVLDENNNTNEKKKGFLFYVGSFFKTIFRWFRRMFFGASKELSDEDKFKIENLESPAKMAAQTFFKRKLAVGALVVLFLLFALVFIGPLFVKIDLNYTDKTQANIAPNYSMRSIPSGLKNNIRSISGTGSFTVGVSNDNELYIWGYAKDALTKHNYAKLPEGLDKNNVLYAAAGTDHVVAITTEGKIYCWGDNSLAQCGYGNEAGMLYMPDEWLEDDFRLDVTKIQQLECGNQATALVYDNKVYYWGNPRSIMNMSELNGLTNIKKVAFSGYYTFVLTNDGKIDGGVSIFGREVGYSNKKDESGKNTKISNFKKYVNNIGVLDIAAVSDVYCFILTDGEMVVTGAFRYNEDVFPVLSEGEKPVKIISGQKHFIMLSDKNKAYSWGLNDKNQASFSGVEANEIFAGSKQSYIANDGKLIKSYGLKGYFFGTDSLGRDILTRIIHGGKMTMTIGAVAVIISTIIAIIIGVISGYFGGWVDMLLMRVSEIVSAIPFLPFAMLLSHVLTYTTVSENTRIFIIMLILGILSWTGLAHMIRGQVLAEREKDFVLAAKAMGVKETKIAFRHILPNVVSIILVSVTLDFAGCLLTESSLSYLGFGVQLPRPTWGNMLNGAKNDITISNFWWQWVFPAIFLGIATICINIIGDTLRDVLDPKSSRSK